MKHVAVVIDLQFALPWHQDCYQGVMRYGEEHGWRCSVDLHAAGMVGDLSSNPYDGVVGRIPAVVARRIESLGLPMVNLTRYVETNDSKRFQNLPGVYIDREAGVRLCVQHLAQVGYPRVAVMALMGFDHELTIEVAKQECLKLGLKCIEPFQFPYDYGETLEQYANTLRSLNQWLASVDKPVGLVVNHTSYARFSTHACMEHGLRVPEEVGIVTQMGERVMLVHGTPKISGVEYDHFLQGYEAAAMLDKLMAGKKVDRPQIWIKPTELVVRDSTDVFLCDDPLVTTAMRYIAAHAREELNVNILAKAIGVSRWTLNRRFEEALGKKPQEEINRLRTDYLKRQLSETQTSIAEICFNCGFSEPSHFTRFFKRMTGQAPSEYRKQQRARYMRPK